MKLSEHFTLKELTRSDTAIRLGIDNTPELAHVAALSVLCNRILEPVRIHTARPIVPSSGYRSPALSDAVGSSSSSQHCRGQAVDFEVFGIDNLVLARWIYNNLEFDQLILEGYNGEPSSGWIHCSYDNLAREQRLQVLRTSDFKTYEEGLPEG